MTILFIIPNLKKGGAERVVSLLTSELSKHHRVVICLFDDDGISYDHGGEIISIGQRAGPRMLRPLKTIIRAYRIAGVLNRIAPDRIIAFMEGANFPAVLAAVAQGVCKKLIVSVRVTPSVFPYTYRQLVKVLYRAPLRVVANSRATCGDLEALGLRNVSFIPNPVSLQAMDGQAREWSNQHKQAFILAAGRVVPQKGFDLLIKAFSKIRNHCSQDLVIIGSGPQLSELQALAQEQHVSERVRFLGEVSNPFAFMRHADAFVLSSRYEGSPNVLAEAMGCGTACIAFRCPTGPEELIEDRRTGVLVDPENTEELASAILDVLQDPTLRRDLGAAARESVRKYDVDKIADEWIRL